MKNNSTKQKVIDAASTLFFQKGFHGTSVRDIAESAAVNVSLISYYFKGKQGLLEYAITSYYETYLTYLEEVVSKSINQSKMEQLKNIVQAIIQYKTDYFQLTFFIQRELSLDTTFVREMTVTYLAKENHLLEKLFFPILTEQSSKYRPYLFMQLKGMLMSPYISKKEWNYRLIDAQALHNFVKMYTETIHHWLDYLTLNKVQQT